MRDFSHRHPATQEVLRRFGYDHLEPGVIRSTKARVADLADEMAASLPDCSELTAGLRKLLEASDCLVRVAVDVHNGPRP